MVILSASLLFLIGLRIPSGFLIPLFFLTIFLIGNIISAVFVLEPKDSIVYGAVTAYLILSLLLYVCLMYYDYQNLMKYFWSGYLVAPIIATTTGILGFFHLVPFYEIFLENGRASGTFKDPNVYGPFLIPAILYLINKMGDYKGFQKILIIVLALFFVFGVFISFSRGAIATLIFSAILMLIIKLKLLNSYYTFVKYIFVGSLAFISLVIVLSISVMNTDKLSYMFDLRAKVLHDYDVDDGGRFSKQELAVQLALEHPLGIGPGMAGEVMDMVPHNVYLLVLVENGFIGFIGWVGFFLYTLFYSYRFLRRQKYIPMDFLPIYATLIGLVLSSFIIDSIHWRSLYVLFGILWGIMLAAEVHERSYMENRPA